MDGEEEADESPQYTANEGKEWGPKYAKQD
jgi:hypothetical protein